MSYADEEWEDFEDEREGRPGNDGEDGDAAPNQALPVAVLPKDFDGNPQDGAQYLAMMKTMYQDLPFFKTVPKPVDNFVANFTPAQPSKTSRHPALPKESWVESYTTHFMSYKKAVMAQPKLPLTVQLPPARERQAFAAFIHGVKRKKLRIKEPIPEVNLADTLDEEEAMANGDIGARAQKQGEDAEMEMNDEQGSDGETAASSKFTFEPELPKHKAAEPLLSTVQSMSQRAIITGLACFNSWIRHGLEAMQEPATLIPTQANGSSHVSAPTTSPCPSLPFPSLYTRWIFALLLHLDLDILFGEDMSEVRELAKTCIDVVKWQVTAGLLADNADARQKEMQAGCWMVVYAVAEGWAQRDLVMDAQRVICRLPH